MVAGALTVVRWKGAAGSEEDVEIYVHGHSALLVGEAGQDVSNIPSGTQSFWVHGPSGGQRHVPDILF